MTSALRSARPSGSATDAVCADHSTSSASQAQEGFGVGPLSPGHGRGPAPGADGHARAERTQRRDGGDRRRRCRARRPSPLGDQRRDLAGQRRNVGVVSDETTIGVAPQHVGRADGGRRGVHVIRERERGALPRDRDVGSCDFAATDGCDRRAPAQPRRADRRARNDEASRAQGRRRRDRRRHGVLHQVPEQGKSETHSDSFGAGTAIGTMSLLVSVTRGRAGRREPDLERVARLGLLGVEQRAAAGIEHDRIAAREHRERRERVQAGRRARELRAARAEPALDRRLEAGRHRTEVGPAQRDHCARVARQEPWRAARTARRAAATLCAAAVRAGAAPDRSARDRGSAITNLIGEARAFALHGRPVHVQAIAERAPESNT